MKIAVTGATGFVGRHVVAELECRGYSPILICRPGKELSPSLTQHPVVRMDLHNAPADAFARIGRPDVLIHLAWAGLPNYRSLHHFEHELPAQYRFLKTLTDSGLQSLIVTGTCFEYGMQAGELSEEVETRPTTPYGFAKDTLRRQLEFLRQQTPFRLTWARLFYLHGEGQAPGSLLPLLMRAVEHGEQTFAMSGGEQLRDYLPATRLAEYLVSLALGPGDCGVLNVCSGKPVSVRALVEGWIREHGWDIRLDLGRYPYPEYEPMAFWGKSGKMRLLEANAKRVVSSMSAVA